MALAVWILTIAVAAGTVLGMLHMRASPTSRRPPLTAGIAHGVVGAFGLIALLFALRGPERGVAAGVGSFGSTAAWLFGGALVSGGFILVRRRKGPSISMVIHAGIAITGYVLVLAWDSLG